MTPTAASTLSWQQWLLDGLKEWQPLIVALPPILILISAFIAWRSIVKNAEVNRRRATVDLIEKSESSEHYRDILSVFKQHFPDDQPDEMLQKLVEPTTDEDRSARRKIQHFLNHYELVAIGILGKSLHEQTYRSWMMTVFIRDWNRAANYIQRERWKWDERREKWIYHRRTYEGFEALAHKWAKRCKLKATTISKHTSSPPPRPVGPGDVAVPAADSLVGNEGGCEPEFSAASSPPTPEKPKKRAPRKQQKESDRR